MADVAVRGADLFSVKLSKASQHNFILSEERFDLSRPCDQILESASAGPSLRYASTIQIVRPSESMAETQPQTPTGFAEFVGNQFPVFHARDSGLFALHTAMTNDVNGRDDARARALVRDRFEPSHNRQWYMIAKSGSNNKASVCFWFRPQYSSRAF